MTEKIEPSFIDTILNRKSYIQKINEQIDTIAKNKDTIRELTEELEDKNQKIQSEITKRNEAYEQRNKMQNKLESSTENTTTDRQNRTQSYTLNGDDLRSFIETVQSMTYDSEIAMTIPIPDSEDLPFILTEDDTIPIQNLNYIREHAPGILVADRQGVIMKFIDAPLYDYTNTNTIPITERFGTCFKLEKQWFMPKGISGFVYGTGEEVIIVEYMDDTQKNKKIIRRSDEESYIERINSLLTYYDTKYGVVTENLGQKIDLPIYTAENHISDIEDTYSDAFKRIWETEIHNIS